jgi:hypothetical protein
MSEPRSIGEVTDYPSLMKVLRARANELHINRSSDETAKLSGLPDKYMAKLLGPRPVRRIGSKTLGAVLGVLQLKLIAVEDAEAMRLYGKRVDKRDDRLVRSEIVTQEFSRRYMQKIGRNGGNKRLDLPPKLRKKLARLGGLAVQAKRRLAQRALPSK